MKKLHKKQRNPMAGSLAQGVFQPKVVPTAKQKEKQKRHPKHRKRLENEG